MSPSYFPRTPQWSDMTDRLIRRLGLPDAVIIGLAAMLGAGVFAAFGPAAAAAGPWLLAGLLIAALVAYANATSTATLAAAMPTSGGGYAYGREQLSPLWGQLAGWAFLTGKAASCAAMALTFGTYVYEPAARALAVGVVIAVTLVNHVGIRKTALATRVILVLVLAALALVITSGFATPESSVVTEFVVTPTGVLQSAGILFFAFAGYARVATLGEEVRNPRRTIPRAVPIALGLALLVYLLVALAGLRAIGWTGLATAAAPLREVVAASPLSGLAAVVSVGAAAATVGVLLSLTAGMGRTTFAMAAAGDLPRPLAQVDDRHRVPQAAGVAVGAVVLVLLLVADLRGAITVSSFLILIYYAIGHASAWTLPGARRRRRRAIAAGGFLGCAVLVVTLPLVSVITGMVLLGVGAVGYLVHNSRRDEASPAA